LDRWVRISYKTRAYLRYGDDFLIFSQKLEKLEMIREDVIKFLEKELSLEVNIKNDKIVKVRQGIKYLGVMIYPSGRKLTKRNVVRINRRSSIRNSASYRSLLEKHQKQSLRTFNWQIMEKISDE